MNKKGFGLISALVLLVIFSFLSINIIQNQNYSSKIDTLKYLKLQSKIYMYNVKEFIRKNNYKQISNYKLNDNRFLLEIKKEDLNNSTKYHIYIKTNNDIPISTYENIIK